MKTLKLGFLTVLGEGENHSQMMDGVFAAAEQNGAHVIRFAVTPSYEDFSICSTELQNVYKIIEKQNLDGLMFLGWLPGVIGEFFDGFLKRFSRIPLVSLGARYDNVPNVYANPKQPLEDLLNHLFQVHGYKNIVFIPPSYPDVRRSIYTEFMKNNGIFDEKLVITDEELLDVPFDVRIKKVLSILLDERKLSIDAFVVMFDTDEQYLYKGLRSRGLNIPDDVAVVSSEDAEFAKYALPPVTAITFPWTEIGYQGCRKIIRIINREEPENSSPVSCRLIIRNSCGCRTSDPSSLATSNSLRMDRTGSKVDYKHILTFSDKLMEIFPDTLLNIDRLLYSFVEDFERNTNTQFFKEFDAQLLKIVQTYPNSKVIEDVEKTMYAIRTAIVSYIAAKDDAVILFNQIMYKSSALLREKYEFVAGHENIRMKITNQHLHVVSQNLSSSFSPSELMNILANSLPNLQIKSCYVFLSLSRSFDEFSMIMNYTDGIRMPSVDGPVALNYISDVIVKRHPRLLCQLLHIEEQFLGIIIFEPFLLDARIYETLTLHISSAIKSALLHEELMEEIALRKQKEKQLMHSANYDSLTDLLNRRSFVRTLHYIFDRAAKKSSEDLRYYLIFIDFDDFKQVNDRFGHDVGDLLIIEISRKIRSLIHPFSYQIPEETGVADHDSMNEAIFRLGGDEFTAIINGISVEEMSDLAEKLVRAVNSPYLLEEHEVCISCSIGISIYPDQAETVELFIKHADTAMYHAKTAKNMYCFYDDTVDDHNH